MTTMPPELPPRWNAVSWLLAPAVTAGALCAGVLLGAPVGLVYPALQARFETQIDEVVNATVIPANLAVAVGGLLLFAARGWFAPVLVGLGAALLAVVSVLDSPASLSELTLHRILDTAAGGALLAGGLGTALLAAGAARRATTAAWVTGFGAGLVLSAVRGLGDFDSEDVATILRPMPWLLWTAVALSAVAVAASLRFAGRQQRDGTDARAVVLVVISGAGLVFSAVAYYFLTRLLDSAGGWLSLIMGMVVLGLAAAAAIVFLSGQISPALAAGAVAVFVAGACGLGAMDSAAHSLGIFPPGESSASLATGIAAGLVVIVLAVAAATAFGRAGLATNAVGLVLLLAGLVLVVVGLPERRSDFAAVLAGAALLLVAIALLAGPWLGEVPAWLGLGLGGAVLVGWNTIGNLANLLSTYELFGRDPDPDFDYAAALRDGYRTGHLILLGIAVLTAGLWLWLVRRRPRPPATVPPPYAVTVSGPPAAYGPPSPYGQQQYPAAPPADPAARQG